MPKLFFKLLCLFENMFSNIMLFIHYILTEFPSFKDYKYIFYEQFIILIVKINADMTKN